MSSRIPSSALQRIPRNVHSVCYSPLQDANNVPGGTLVAMTVAMANATPPDACLFDYPVYMCSPDVHAYDASKALKGATKATEVRVHFMMFALMSHVLSSPAMLTYATVKCCICRSSGPSLGCCCTGTWTAAPSTLKN